MLYDAYDLLYTTFIFLLSIVSDTHSRRIVVEENSVILLEMQNINFTNAENDGQAAASNFTFSHNSKENREAQVGKSVSRKS